MRRRAFQSGLCAAGLRAGSVLGWLGLGGVPQAWAQPVPALRLPALLPQVRTLANGLRVLLLPNAAPGAGAAAVGSSGVAGTVAVQVWYRVGGKDDPPGRSGFAHLFEHMMFKRTRYLADEAFDRLTEDVGGHNNAFTTEDATVYLNEVPRSHLEPLLWAEAERMARLQVDEANFRSERAVVEAEFRQRVLSEPYGRFFHGMAAAFWRVHPYKRPVIGDIPQLHAATLADVQQFHATYYRPDNAVLVLAGDFELGTAWAWVERYFGLLTAPSTPVPRVTVREPVRERDESVVLTAPQVPAPAVALLWQAPGAAHRDAAALRIAAALLGDGEAARLPSRLIEREQVAQATGFSADLYTDGGRLSAWAIAAGERSAGTGARDERLRRLEEALLRQVRHLAYGVIPITELDRVRTRLLTEALVARQTAEGRGLAVGWAQAHRGDPMAADAELSQWQAVRAEDVQRVLQRYVVNQPKVSLRYVQEVRGPVPGASPTADPAWPSLTPQERRRGPKEWLP